ncbi:MAG: hypothetical protein IH913_06295 [Proteobacteria bacterium]|nr:hypothetical protein [Pseudomonadota bacterium]
MTAIMRMDAIAIGNNPPDDVNVIIDVPVGVFIMEDNARQDEKAGELIVESIERAKRSNQRESKNDS